MCGLRLARVNETEAGGPPKFITAPPAFQHRSSGRRCFWKSLIRENLATVSQWWPLPPRGQGTARSLPSRVRAGRSSRGALPAWARRRNQQEVSIVSRPLTLANTDAEECNTQPRAVSVCVPYTSGVRAGSAPKHHRRPQAEPLQNLCTGRHGPGCPGRPRLTHEASNGIPWPQDGVTSSETQPSCRRTRLGALVPPAAPALEAGSLRRSADRFWRHVSARPSVRTRGQAQRQRDRQVQTETLLHGARRVGGRLSWGPVPPPRLGTGGPQPTARRPPLVCPGQSPVPARPLPHRRAGLARVPEPPSVCPVRVHVCVCVSPCLWLCVHVHSRTRVSVCVRARRCFCVSCRPCECASPDSCPRVRPASAPAHPARLPRPRSRPAARPQLNGEGTEPAEASLARASDCASHGLSAQARHTDWAA